MNQVEAGRWLVTNFSDFDADASQAVDKFKRDFSEKASMSGSASDASRRDIADIKIFSEIRTMDAPPTMSVEGIVEAIEKESTTGVDIWELASAVDSKMDMQSFSVLPAVFGRYAVLRTGMLEPLVEHGAIADSEVFLQSLVDFWMKMGSEYSTKIAYHTSLHATDTMTTTDWFMCTWSLQESATILDHLIALIAAAIHDVGHPGTNNDFNIKTQSHLALRYNDQSVLENMSIARSFEAMNDDAKIDWYTQLGQKTGLKGYVRKAMIHMVLATDMKHHADHMMKLENLVESVENQFETIPGPTTPGAARTGSDHSLFTKQEMLDDKLLLLSSVLHAADISNAVKSIESYTKWTQRVLDEFWMQGDQERRLGLPISPLCDRVSGIHNVPSTQIGFMNFVVSPMYESLLKIIDDLEGCLANMKENMTFWRAANDAGKTYEDLFGSRDSLGVELGKRDGRDSGVSGTSFRFPTSLPVTRICGTVRGEYSMSISVVQQLDSANEMRKSRLGPRDSTAVRAVPSRNSRTSRSSSRKRNPTLAVSPPKDKRNSWLSVPDII